MHQRLISPLAVKGNPAGTGTGEGCPSGNATTIREPEFTPPLIHEMSREDAPATRLHRTMEAPRRNSSVGMADYCRDDSRRSFVDNMRLWEIQSCIAQGMVVR